MRQQKAHLEVREWVFARKQQLVPVIGAVRRGRMLWYELVREMEPHAPFGPHRSCEDDKQVEAAGDLPAPEVSGGRRSPIVRAERAARATDRSRRLDDLYRVDAGFVGRILRRELLIEIFQRDD